MNITRTLQFLLIGFLLCPAVYAQDTTVSTTPFVSYTDRMDSIFSPLDKNAVPYGILYNRVFPLANLPEVANGDSVNIGMFVQALSEFERANYTYSHRDTSLDHTNLRDYVRYENDSNEIPILTLNANFAVIDSAAYRDGRLEVKTDGLTYAGTNTQSPYLSSTVKLVTLGIGSNVDSGRAYTLFLGGGFEFGNNTSLVKSVLVENLTSSDAWTLSGYTKVPVVFAKSGINTIKITLTLEDLSFRTLYQFVHVSAREHISFCESGDIPITATIPFQGYEESSPGYGNGNYKIFYSVKGGCQNHITKPIILLDGFDALDQRSVNMIYDQYLSYGPRTDKVGMYDFAMEMRQEGYDIIILNFPRLILYTLTYQNPLHHNWPPIQIPVYGRDGGVDYMERNAFILVKLIQDLKTMMPTNSTEKFVVIGPSMGGQISRYALTYMEQKKQQTSNAIWDHNTRLWVSFDSPHLGANIPIGFQEMLRVLYQTYNAESAGVTYNTQLRSPASRQLLISQTYPQLGHFPVFNSQAMLANIAHFTLSLNDQEPFRVQWKNTLNSIGFPANLRKVALVNGTYKGGEYHTPGSKMFELHAVSNGSGTLLLKAKTYFVNSVQSTLSDIWAFPLDQSSLSAAFALPYGPLDGCPGGIYDVQGEFYEQALAPNSTSNPDWPFGFAHNVIIDRTNDISFIPTPSSLALTNSNFDWRTPLDFTSYVCSQRTPFDNIFVPEQNEKHVSLTVDNVLWLKKEILNSANGCTRLCPASTWPDDVCDKANLTLYLNNPNHDPIVWTEPTTSPWTTSNIVPQADGYIGNQSYINFKIDHTYVNNPSNTLIGSVTSSCGGDYKIKKVFNIVDAPAPHASLSIANTQTNGKYNVTFHVDPPSYGTSYTWDLWYGSNHQSGTGAPTAITHLMLSGQYVSYQVNATSACGNATISDSKQIIGGGLYKQAHVVESNQLIVSPNPSKAIWTFQFINKDRKPKTIIVTDCVGRIVSNQSVELPTIKDVRCDNLAAGIYTATVSFDNGDIEKVQLTRQ